VRVGQRTVYNAKQIKVAELAQQEAADKKEHRRALWHRLNEYCGERAGAITTAPFHWPARLEVMKESPLPAKLRELGWVVLDKGQETRLGPQILTHDLAGREKPQAAFGTSYGFAVRDVFDVALPG